MKGKGKEKTTQSIIVKINKLYFTKLNKDIMHIVFVIKYKIQE